MKNQQRIGVFCKVERSKLAAAVANPELMYAVSHDRHRSARWQAERHAARQGLKQTGELFPGEEVQMRHLLDHRRVEPNSLHLVAEYVTYL